VAICQLYWLLAVHYAAKKAFTWTIVLLLPMPQVHNEFQDSSNMKGRMCGMNFRQIYHKNMTFLLLLLNNTR
jgi:hypothetical protein